MSFLLDTDISLSNDRSWSRRPSRSAESRPVGAEGFCGIRNPGLPLRVRLGLPNVAASVLFVPPWSVWLRGYALDSNTTESERRPLDVKGLELTRLVAPSPGAPLATPVKRG
jgi:hypothetical protein